MNSTPSALLDRQMTRHLRRWPRPGVMRNLNSSGISAAITPEIFAPPFEKLDKKQGCDRRPKNIVAAWFHSTRKFVRRSARIAWIARVAGRPYLRPGA